MAREIKYKAYHKPTKTIREVLVIDWLNGLVDLDTGLIEQSFDDVVLLQYTNLKDENAVEIYEGNILKMVDTPYWYYLGVLKFGEYEQDGSGDEYGPTTCLGFYVECRYQVTSGVDAGKKEEIPERDYRRTTSVAEFDNIEVIGNVYEHPHLLERD